ncbi:MAG: hypothetical protein CL926_13760, partial [Deltaproteobacteria bacterium]|nr:hypothetical protein [Deltaproteobacteria bacterium]
RNPAGKHKNTPTKKVTRIGFTGSRNLSDKITAASIKIDGMIVAARIINFFQLPNSFYDSFVFIERFLYSR